VASIILPFLIFAYGVVEEQQPNRLVWLIGFVYVFTIMTASIMTSHSILDLKDYPNLEALLGNTDIPRTLQLGVLVSLIV
jgi:ABC-type multidrug transport system permease subunit